MKKYILSIILIISCIPISGMIVEHAEFASIFNYLDESDFHKNTVVLLDIDNTIATIAKPYQYLGSDHWVSWAVSNEMQRGLDAVQAIQAILPLYYELQHHIDLMPVEPTTPEIIQQLQTRGITVVALTLRSLEISDRTIAQLKAIGIDLTHATLSHEELVGSDDLIFHFKNGIIFCAGADKGTVLKYVLDHFNHTPTKVILIDDKEKYLHSVQKILHPDIPFIGIRYSNMDEKVRLFDHTIAQTELENYRLSK